MVTFLKHKHTGWRWWVRRHEPWMALGVLLIAAWVGRDYLIEQFHIATRDTPFYVERPCDFSIEERSMDCGYLYVQQDRSQDGGPLYRLPVVTFRSKSDEVQPDPVVFVNGGPGIASLQDSTISAFFWEYVFSTEPWLNDRDVIVFDPRGIGGSVPSADCPAVKRRLDYSSEYKKKFEMISECFDRLQEQGIDLKHLSTDDMAADLNDLRIAMNIEEWDIWGVSHGTRVALTASAIRPDGIRSMILQGIYPPINVEHPEFMIFANLLDRIFATCAASRECDKKYPSLKNRLLILLSRFNNHPIRIKVDVIRASRREETFILDGTLLLDAFFSLLYSVEGILSIPTVIRDLESGQSNELLSELSLMDFISYGRLTSVGAKWAIICNEFTAPSLETTQIVRQNYPWFAEAHERWIEQDLFLNFCQDMSVAPIPLSYDFSKLNVPTLLLNGEWDPTTPAIWATQIAELLPNAHLFIFPNMSHDVGDNECAKILIAEFLKNPNRRPEDPCFAEQDEALFQ